ncbi:MAG TPA: hypothetical protein VKY74_05175 [Chloroflexia bacterium]|nr:hypothetical protein [Chloroflexia bacterium]
MTAAPDVPPHAAVQRLLRLVWDAKREGQFITMGHLADQAVALAAPLGDLPLLVKTRFWLADAWRLQTRYREALPIYIWMIGLATDPQAGRPLTDRVSQWYLARGFMDFVSAGRTLPELSTAALLAVIADGLAWMEQIGHPEWTAGLRMWRGELFKWQERLVVARQELETALALLRRHPELPGPTLADCQLCLAELLSQHAVGAYAAAAALAEEVLADPASSTGGRLRAYAVLADACVDLGDLDRAEQASQDLRALGQRMEGPRMQPTVYATVGRVARARGRADEARAAAVTQWRWARRIDTPGALYGTLRNAMLVRLLQARLAAGLPATETDRPAGLPATANRAAAGRYLASAGRFLARARPLAARLDQSAGAATYGKGLAHGAREVARLEALLAAPQAP